MYRPRPKSSRFELSFSKRFLFLGRNSGLHGLGHLFREDGNFLARLFWLAVLVASTGCLYMLLMPVVRRGNEVCYTVDTRYLAWTTTFPAVTVCELYHKTSQRKFSELYPDLIKPQPFDLQRYLTELVYNKALMCRKGLCEPCSAQGVPCDLKWREIIEKIHLTCDELITDCILDGKPFPCCTKFHLVDSEYGPCYSFNTLQGERSSDEPLYSLNRTTGPGVISFRLKYDATVSLHSTEELSTNFLDIEQKLELRPLFVQHNDVEFVFSLVEFENDAMLANADVSMRGCRYLHEIPDTPFDTYSVYSYGACRLARNTEHAYKHCGCIHPGRDISYKDKYCNFTGMNCLVEYESHRLKEIDDEDLDEDDPCLPSCLESELTTVHISRRWIITDNPLPGIKVAIRMAGLPNVRYQRNLLRSELDLVVSVGGMAALFFGASIFSIVEIFYLFLRKPNN